MRAGLLRRGAFLLPLIFGACADVSGPTAIPGDKALADCYWRDDGSVYCDPVSPNWECDPYMELDWCRGGGGDCMMSTGGGDQAIQSCPGGGGAGLGTGPGGGTGGGTRPPPPPPDDDEPAADTCHTGDPVVDDPDVSTGLQDLWLRSNPDANLAQRKETAGWIVQTAAGYSIVPLVDEFRLCGFRGPDTHYGYGGRLCPHSPVPRR